jgi:hypothetical protein
MDGITEGKYKIVQDGSPVELVLTATNNEMPVVVAAPWVGIPTQTVGFFHHE